MYTCWLLAVNNYFCCFSNRTLHSQHVQPTRIIPTLLTFVRKQTVCKSVKLVSVHMCSDHTTSWFLVASVDVEICTVRLLAFIQMSKPPSAELVAATLTVTHFQARQLDRFTRQFRNHVTTNKDLCVYRTNRRY